MESPEKINHMEAVVLTYKMMHNYGIKLIYEGEINQSLTKVLAALTEKKLEDGNEDAAVTRKVYHVMIECLQNLCKHSDAKKDDNSEIVANEIFMISEDKSNYVITTGNMVNNSNLEKIRVTIDTINSFSKEELKAAYVKQMKEGSYSEKGGAGLGFLDIAKKTGNKFEYHIERLTNDSSFFVLKTNITKI